MFWVRRILISLELSDPNLTSSHDPSYDAYLHEIAHKIGLHRGMSQNATLKHVRQL